jgi:hypothetical protein
MTNVCLFDRRKDGRYECIRPRCRYVTKKDTYEKPPIRACKGIGPGTLLTDAAAFIGITEERWLRLKKAIGAQPKCGCQKRVEFIDRAWYTYLRNYKWNLTAARRFLDRLRLRFGLGVRQLR